MPNRVIKESICDSERINKLTPFEEITFYRLLVNADDYGCFDAREMVVKSRLFPLREIKTAEVKRAVDRLAEVGLINLYTVKGKPYLIINKWAEHQRLRVSRHKFPTPDEADETHDSDNSPQLAATRRNLPPDARTHKESESESESESETESEKRKAQETWFEKFWKAYPRKVNRVGARKAFDKIKPDEALLEKMVAAIGKQIESEQWTKDNGQFIPYPATWLNNKRWEDELTAAKRKPIPAADFEQRDYSGVNEEILQNLNDEMRDFMASENEIA